MRYRLVKITNNIKEYPECELDTLEFPHLVNEITDEQDYFVINTETQEFYPADEFFYMADISIKYFDIVGLDND